MRSGSIIAFASVSVVLSQTPIEIKQTPTKRCHYAVSEENIWAHVCFWLTWVFISPFLIMAELVQIMGCSRKRA